MGGGVKIRCGGISKTHEKNKRLSPPFILNLRVLSTVLTTARSSFFLQRTSTEHRPILLFIKKIPCDMDRRRLLWENEREQLVSRLQRPASSTFSRLHESEWCISSGTSCNVRYYGLVTRAQCVRARSPHTSRVGHKLGRQTKIKQNLETQKKKTLIIIESPRLF